MKLDSIGVREAADYAASLRGRGGDGEFLVTTFDTAQNNYAFSVMAAPPQPAGEAVVIPCNTAFVQPNRAAVTAVQISAQWVGDGCCTIDMSTSLMQYDAVFWTEASVEKFLFPYYASKYQWAAAQVLTFLSEAFYGYVPQFMNEPGAGFGPDADIPFAMAHLPRSDYVPEEVVGTGPVGPSDPQEGVDMDVARPQIPPGVMQELYVLSIQDGQVRHRALADFIRDRARARAGAKAGG